MEEKFDCYMTIKAVDSKGVPVSEWEWKIRCSNLLEFTKEIQSVYEKHHPDKKDRSLKSIKTLTVQGDLK